MTNEELALKIKAGETELTSELWLQIEKFVRQQAYKFANGDAWSGHCSAAGITHEDLYCAGYFALEPAIEYFDIEKGAFLTVFGFFLKSAFYKEIGVSKSGKTWRSAQDKLGPVQSLQATLFTGKDGDEITLESHIEDENAQKAFDDVEDALYNQRLHEDLEEALKSLRPRDEAIIRDHYYNQLSADEQAKKYRLSSARVSDIRFRALSLLRKHAKLQEYRSRFLGSTNFTGFHAWKDSGMSQQERFVLKLEEYEELLGLK